MCQSVIVQKSILPLALFSLLLIDEYVYNTNYFICMLLKIINNSNKIGINEALTK